MNVDLREITKHVDRVGLSQILAVPYWLLASSPAFKYARASNSPCTCNYK